MQTLRCFWCQINAHFFYLCDDPNCFPTTLRTEITNAEFPSANIVVQIIAKQFLALWNVLNDAFGWSHPVVL